jgi:D-glycero-D-manno-heptose 1,7-bisphosphate phosphatase
VKIVILDRDGVINYDAETHIRSSREWHPIPGSLEAIAQLTHAAYRVVVATNQSGISRDLYDLEALNRINQKMHTFVQEHGGHIDAIMFSPYSDDREPSRKPNPGMLKEIASRLAISLRGVPVVGDSLRDLQAAQAVDARPILVRTGNGAQTEREAADALGKVEIFQDLADFTQHLLAPPPPKR